MDGFLYDNGLRFERVKSFSWSYLQEQDSWHPYKHTLQWWALVYLFNNVGLKLSILKKFFFFASLQFEISTKCFAAVG